MQSIQPLHFMSELPYLPPVHESIITCVPKWKARNVVCVCLLGVARLLATTGNNERWVTESALGWFIRGSSPYPRLLASRYQPISILNILIDSSPSPPRTLSYILYKGLPFLPFWTRRAMNKAQSHQISGVAEKRQRERDRAERSVQSARQWQTVTD